MTSSQVRPTCQAAGVTDDTTPQYSILPASRLASHACDQFWAARRAGNRAAMAYWSARESVLRRLAHGGTAVIPMAANTLGVG